MPGQHRVAALVGGERRGRDDDGADGLADPPLQLRPEDRACQITPTTSYSTAYTLICHEIKWNDMTWQAMTVRPYLGGRLAPTCRHTPSCGWPSHSARKLAQASNGSWRRRRVAGSTSASSASAAAAASSPPAASAADTQGPAKHGSPRHRMPCYSIHRRSNALDDLAGPGPGRYCLPRHRTPCYSRNRKICVSMTWRAMCLAVAARHVIGCHLTQETGVQYGRPCLHRRRHDRDAHPQRGVAERAEELIDDARVVGDGGEGGRGQQHRVPGAHTPPLLTST
jgi:hypothetical protein